MRNFIKDNKIRTISVLCMIAFTLIRILLPPKIICLSFFFIPIIIIFLGIIIYLPKK